MLLILKAARWLQKIAVKIEVAKDREAKAQKNNYGRLKIKRIKKYGYSA